MTIILTSSAAPEQTGYQRLVDAIKSYSENYGDDFILYIDTYIRQAEKRIYNDARLPVSRKTAPLVIDGTGMANLPADFIEVLEVATPTAQLLQKEPSFLTEAYGTATGEPEFYAYVDNDTLLVAPRPTAPVTGTVAYFGYPTSITLAGETWLNTNYDHALLSACLFEAAMYMKAEADMVAVYKAQYETAIAPLKALTKGDKFRAG